MSSIQERAKYILNTFKIDVQQFEKPIENIASYLDHTQLASDATPEIIKKLCQEALKYKFASVCVNGCYADLAVEQLKGSDVKTCCVIGFPLGSMTTAAKVFETKDLIARGVQEIDMVINMGWMKAGMYREVFEEIQQIANVCHEQHRVLKVIIEATCLEQEQLIIDACILSQSASADFVKTSTGTHKNGGAKVEHVKLMREVVGKSCGVKAAGGVRSAEDCVMMIKAGASRIGTSGGVKIAEGAMHEGGY
ncbi:Deoxyribose-phosphate_aldolase [Hexamita inflata]|uniref:deoxyribose-phosphate aldolase n=1 Tax=Hexamita inflata TaxID=28002 RepID=A0AA86QNJ8_9EUKA|nr:Deoxyribose-phosphate aldolase [Hexamita inflata]